MTCDLLKMIGNPQPLALQVLAGRYGWTGWRLLSLLISSRQAVWNSNLSPSNLPTDSNALPCSFRQKNPFLTSNGPKVTPMVIFKQDEVQFSTYNFTVADTAMLFQLFDTYEKECQRLLKEDLVLPAYDYVLKCSHTFNMAGGGGGYWIHTG